MSDIFISSDLPAEIIVYNDKQFTVYINGIKSHIIDFIKNVDEGTFPRLYPLSNHRFLFSYYDSEHKIAIGSYYDNKLDYYDMNLNNIIDDNLVTNNLVTNNLVTIDKYVKINKDNTLDITPLNYKYPKIISLTNVNELLAIDTNHYSIYRYDNISVKIPINMYDNIFGWFDNQYVIVYQNSYLAIYNINEKENRHLEFLNNIIISGFPYVAHYFSATNIDLNNISYTYLKSYADMSIDIFLTDYESNITILHISSNNEIQMESYSQEEHKLDFIASISGDEYDILVIDQYEQNYIINRYSRVVIKIGNGITATFSNEIYRSFLYETIKSLDIGLNTNVQGIIGEYII